MNPDFPKVPYLDSLRAELIARIARRRARRRRAALGAAAVTAALLVGGLAGPLGESSGPPPALAISTEEEWISLRIVDPEADPERMTEELQATGIDGRVCGLATEKPAQVGAWLALGAAYADEDLRAELGEAPGSLEPGPEPEETGDALERWREDEAHHRERFEQDLSKRGVPPEERQQALEAFERETVRLGPALLPGEHWLVEPGLIRIRADVPDRPQPSRILLFLGQPSDATSASGRCTDDELFG